MAATDIYASVYHCRYPHIVMEMERVEMSLEMRRYCPTQRILARPMPVAEVSQSTI
jgi:hypothetical protein